VVAGPTALTGAGQLACFDQSIEQRQRLSTIQSRCVAHVLVGYWSGDGEPNDDIGKFLAA
jgi:hypothetical protein